MPPNVFRIFILANRARTAHTAHRCELVQGSIMPYDPCFAHSGLHPPLTIHASRMRRHEAQCPRVCRSLQRFELLNASFQTSGFCPQLPWGLARLGALCQRCKYFGEMKVGLPRIKKGNESSWLGSFLHPFECWWATPVRRRLDPGVRLRDNSFCVWHVFSASQTHACEPQRGNTRERCLIFLHVPQRETAPAQRKNGIFFVMTFRGQRHLHPGDTSSKATSPLLKC